MFLKSSLISFNLIISCFIVVTCLLSTIFAQKFEFDEEDYYSSSENNNPINSEEDTSADKNPSDKKSMNSNEDTDKEVCINNQQQMESASYSDNSDLSSDSSSYYSADYHFIKKFDREENLVDSWGTRRIQRWTVSPCSWNNY